MPFAASRDAILTTAVIAGLLGVAPGCALVGSRTIQAGRIEYNEVLGHTDAQQALLNIVRTRYGEPTTSLAVASVTANAKIHAETGVNIGFGPSDNFAGNLVPLSGGFYYEENPTISYVPVQGKEQVRQLTAPLPLDITVSLLRSAVDESVYLNTLVRRINGVRNPEFVPPDAAQPDPRFPRIVALISGLARRGELSWVSRPGAKNEFAAVISDYEPDHVADVRELLGLLGVARPVGQGSVVLDAALAVGDRAPASLAIATRSAYELLLVLAAATEVPAEDERSGRALTFPPIGPAGSALHIQRAAHKPADASVTVPFKGNWFYIADTDQATKQFFYVLQVLWSAMIAESAGQMQAAPLLTIPVSK